MISITYGFWINQFDNFHSLYNILRIRCGMKKVIFIWKVLSSVLLVANFAGATEPVEYPRYLPPAQTRDEIIQEELRKQQMPDRQEPVIIMRFAAGSSEVNSKYKKEVAELAAYLNEHPEAALKINGYTDNTGAPAANVKLSERRARKLKEMLVKEFNIDGARLATRGWGAEKPVASNSTAAGRQKNRRVEALIGSK